MRIIFWLFCGFRFYGLRSPPEGQVLKSCRQIAVALGARLFYSERKILGTLFLLPDCLLVGCEFHESEYHFIRGFVGGKILQGLFQISCGLEMIAQLGVHSPNFERIPGHAVAILAPFFQLEAILESYQRLCRIGLLYELNSLHEYFPGRRRKLFQGLYSGLTIEFLQAFYLGFRCFWGSGRAAGRSFPALEVRVGAGDGSGRAS